MRSVECFAIKTQATTKELCDDLSGMNGAEFIGGMGFLLGWDGIPQRKSFQHTHRKITWTKKFTWKTCKRDGRYHCPVEFSQRASPYIPMTMHAKKPPYRECIQLVVLAPNEKLFHSFLSLADTFQQQMLQTETNHSDDNSSDVPLLDSYGNFVPRDANYSASHRSATLSHVLPALQPILKVFLVQQLDDLVGDNTTYTLLQEAIKEADVVVTGWIFEQRLATKIADILKPVHHNLLACIVFPSSPVLIHYNKLGHFELCRWTETQRVLSRLCHSKEITSAVHEEETNKLQLQLLQSFRILPKLLNYIGEEKREDICTYMLSYRHWVAASFEDVKLCLSFIIERSLINIEKSTKEEVPWMATIQEDLQSMKNKMKQLWQVYSSSITDTSSTNSIRSLPPPKKLQSAGMEELVKLIAICLYQHGCTLEELAALCSFKYSASCQREWNRFAEQLHQKFHLRYPAELAKELLELSEKIQQGEHRMPRACDVLGEKRQDLHQSILRLGGYRKAAKILGLRRYRGGSKKLQGNPLQKFSVFEEELRQFLRQRAKEIDSQRAEWIEKIMPRMVDFREAGRSDLLEAIQYHGGQHAVARKLGLQMHYQATCNEYIRDFGCLETELKRLLSEELGDVYQSNEMPTLHDLRQLGRIDLITAIRIHGGMHKVASKLNWKLCKGSRSTQLRIRDLNWLKTELLRWLKKQGMTELCMVPTSKQLLEDARPDLVRAIQYHGGREAVAKQLGMVKGDKTIFDESFFFTDWSGLEEEEKEQQQNNNRKETLSDGNSTRREAHYWCRLENVRRELLAFIYEYGQPGVMPTRAELLRAGRGDLLRGMTIHGGQKAIARDLSLVMVSRVKKNKHRNDTSCKR